MSSAPELVFLYICQNSVNLVIENSQRDLEERGKGGIDREGAEGGIDKSWGAPTKCFFKLRRQ